MSTSNGQVSQQSPATQPQLSGGLFLTGVVIAVRTEDKEWEKEKYTQTTVSVSDGQQVIVWKYRHDEKSCEPPKLFQPIRLRVLRANTEKGQITVGGVLAA